MRGELTPITEPGRRFVALAEEHAADFATRADAHDREGSFPHENFEAMKQSGFLAGPAPEEIGGMGVFSLHDYSIALSRLGRGDGSTAIAVNMHLISVWVMHRMLRGVQAGGEGPPAAVLEGLLKGVVAGGIVAAVTGTEAGTALQFPNAEVTKDGENFVLNGHKIFGTLSPYATLFFVTARLPDGNGGNESVMCMLGRGTPGQEIRDNWDALGMRASGSGDVMYRDVKLPAASVIRSGRQLGDQAIGVGEPGSANLGLLASFLGIAEAAATTVIEQAKTRKKGPSNTTMASRAWMQQLIGEMDVDLTTARGMLAYNAQHVDRMVAAYPKRDMPEDLQREAERIHQATKYVVNRKAIDAVDKALTASGGAGYMSKSPLSRMYRDVRAGPFMQPFSPPEALAFIGRTVLDQDVGNDI